MATSFAMNGCLVPRVIRWLVRFVAVAYPMWQLGGSSTTRSDNIFFESGRSMPKSPDSIFDRGRSGGRYKESIHGSIIWEVTSHLYTICLGRSIKGIKATPCTLYTVELYVGKTRAVSLLCILYDQHK